jgi:hypothetical protein
MICEWLDALKRLRHHHPSAPEPPDADSARRSPIQPVPAPLDMNGIWRECYGAVPRPAAPPLSGMTGIGFLARRASVPAFPAFHLWSFQVEPHLANNDLSRGLAPEGDL